MLGEEVEEGAHVQRAVYCLQAFHGPRGPGRIFLGFAAEVFLLAEERGVLYEDPFAAAVEE